MTHFRFVVISQIFESFRRFLVVFYGSDCIAVVHCPPIFVTLSNPRLLPVGVQFDSRCEPLLPIVTQNNIICESEPEHSPPEEQSTHVEHTLKAFGHLLLVSCINLPGPEHRTKIWAHSRLDSDLLKCSFLG